MKLSISLAALMLALALAPVMHAHHSFAAEYSKADNAERNDRAVRLDEPAYQDLPRRDGRERGGGEMGMRGQRSRRPISRSRNYLITQRLLNCRLRHRHH